MQNFYETLLIVAPEADEEGVSAVIGDLRAAIESDGGTVLQARVWERRKLAYTVKGKTDGIYVLIHAEGERTLPAVLKDSSPSIAPRILKTSSSIPNRIHTCIGGG